MHTVASGNRELSRCQDRRPAAAYSKPILLLGAICILFNRFIMRFGLRRPIDGWRRGATLAFAEEPGRFFLSCFDLDPLCDHPRASDLNPDAIQDHIAQRLGAFLAGENEFHVRVKEVKTGAEIVPRSGPSHTLRFEPWVDGPERFIRPDQWSSPAAEQDAVGQDAAEQDSAPVFEFVCRCAPDRSADLWIRVNHAAVDGLPVQEMLARLEGVWGTRRSTVFPSTETFQPFAEPRPSPGRPGIAEVQTFIDFTPILRWRKQVNQALPQPMTLSAAIIWWLGRHPALSRRHIGTTIEIPATDRLGRAVGVIVFRAADFLKRPEPVAQYVREFNHQVDLTRRRKSMNCRTIDAAAYIPPGLEKIMLFHGLNRKARAFGSICLTMIKDAKVFGAPLGDAGHYHGVIAIGNVTETSEEGDPVGCVIVKGPRQNIAEYARILQEAIAAADRAPAAQPFVS